MGPQSSIDCYLVKQTRHHGNGDNLCHLQNVQLDLSVFSDEAITGEAIKVSVNGLTVHVYLRIFTYLHSLFYRNT